MIFLLNNKFFYTGSFEVVAMHSWNFLTNFEHRISWHWPLPFIKIWYIFLQLKVNDNISSSIKCKIYANTWDWYSVTGIYHHLFVNMQKNCIQENHFVERNESLYIYDPMIINIRAFKSCDYDILNTFLNAYDDLFILCCYGHLQLTSYERFL